MEASPDLTVTLSRLGHHAPELLGGKTPTWADVEIPPYHVFTRKHGAWDEFAHLGEPVIIDGGTVDERWTTAELFARGNVGIKVSDPTSQPKPLALTDTVSALDLEPVDYILDDRAFTVLNEVDAAARLLVESLARLEHVTGGRGGNRWVREMSSWADTYIARGIFRPVHDLKYRRPYEAGPSAEGE